MINLNKLLIIFIDVLLYIALYLSSNADFITIERISWMALWISLYIIITMFPLKKGNGISVSFLVIYCVAILGRAVLQYAFDYKPDYNFFDTFRIFTEEALIDALILGVYSLIALHIGILSYSGLKEKKLDNYYERKGTEKLKLSALKITGKSLFAISLPPSAIMYVNGFSSSYGARETDNADTLLGLLSGLMLPALIFLMVTKKSSWIYLLGILYYFPQLFWGARGRPILQVVILTFIYFKYVHKKRVTLRKKLFYVLGSLFILNLFNVIKEVRNIPPSIWLSELPRLFTEKLMNSNPVLEVIYEVGLALAPTAGTVELVPQDINIQFGKTLFYSALVAIPDPLSIRPEVISIYGNVGNLVSMHFGSSFGASILQDFFINFMWLTPIFMFIIGRLIQKYSLTIVYEKNIIKTAFLSILIYPILWWPRSSLGYIFRYSLVTILPPLILYFFYKSYYLKRSKIRLSSKYSS